MCDKFPGTRLLSSSFLPGLTYRFAVLVCNPGNDGSPMEQALSHCPPRVHPTDQGRLWPIAGRCRVVMQQWDFRITPQG